MVFAGTLQSYPELVRELGGDPDAMMGRFGISPDILGSATPRVSYRAMIALLEYTANALIRPDFGMFLAKRQGGGKVFGPIGIVMRNSGTLGDALRYVRTHIHAYSLAAHLNIEADRAHHQHRVEFDILLDHIPAKAQTMEQLLLLAQDNALDITNGHVRVREVHFRHQPLSPLAVYRDYFGCEVLFDQAADCLIFDEADVRAPIIDAKPQHYEMAAYYIDTHFPPAAAPLHARVRGLVRKYLGLSDCRIERVADELCIHPRTLHRRLKWEGKSFEDIKDEERRDMALYYLVQTNAPLTHISAKLGYSETSVLSRSCLRWFRHCPSEMRALIRSQRAPSAYAG